MPRVLAIEPNYDVGSTLRRILDGHGDDVLVVDSNAAALESIRHEIPDLVLMSALLSPTDEDDLFDYLKSLPAASHVQTLTIPQFRSTPETTTKSKFSFLRGRRSETAAGGCDPALFANQVSDYLDRARALRRELAEYAAPDGVDNPPDVATLVAATIADPDETVDTEGSPLIFLSKEVENQKDEGRSNTSGPSIFLPEDDSSSDTQTEEIAEIRREAEAQTKAAESLATELARVKEETEQQVADELAAARSEAAERQSIELARVREETERAFAAELERARSEAARQHADELAKVQSDSDRLENRRPKKPVWRPKPKHAPSRQSWPRSRRTQKTASPRRSSASRQKPRRYGRPNSPSSRPAPKRPWTGNSARPERTRRRSLRRPSTNRSLVSNRRAMNVWRPS